jgi:hypothetical protein
MALNIITLNELKKQSQILLTHQATQPDDSSIRQLRYQHALLLQEAKAGTKLTGNLRVKH